jgi:hypothetical protein
MIYSFTFTNCINCQANETECERCSDSMKEYV